MDTSVERSAELRLGPHRLAWGERTFVMAVVNATPDSFSGDGVAGDPAALGARVARIVAESPDLIDVGGESTRPGAADVPAAEEIRRVLPALEAVRAISDRPLSIDTRNAAVARRGVAAGATVINDVSGGTHDPAILEVAAEAAAAYVITHNRRAQPVHSEIGGHYGHVTYTDLMREVIEAAEDLVARAESAGLPRRQLIFDPGFGFGKTPTQNLELLRRLAELRVLGLPLLVGMSRKSFVGHVLALPATQRLEGSLAAATIAVAQGVDIVRTHDVEATRRAVRLADAVYRA